jgi:hypothetical protein
LAAAAVEDALGTAVDAEEDAAGDGAACKAVAVTAACKAVAVAVVAVAVVAVAVVAAVAGGKSRCGMVSAGFCWFLLVSAGFWKCV